MKRRDAILSAAVVLIVAANLWWLYVLRDDTGDTIFWLGLLGSLAFATAGAVAMRLRPGNPTGIAMLVLALVLNLGEASAETLVPWRFTIGYILAGAPTPLLAMLALCFPTGRPRGWWAWSLFAALGGTTAAFITIVALWGPPGAFCLTCPPAGNVLFVGPAPFDLKAAAPHLQKGLAGLLALAMITLIVRWVRASRPARRVLGPIVLTTVLLAAKSAWDLISLARDLWGDGFAAFRLYIIYPNQVLNALIPLMFLLAVARSEFGRSPLARLLADVVDESAPARVDHALARALGDRSVRVGYRADGAEGFVDLDGRALQLPAAGDATRAKFVGDAEDPFAVIVHDAALAEEGRQLEAAAAAAAMALRRERLRAQLRVRLQQLSESRERLIGTVEDQRLRIESALERGVEDRLVELSSILDDVRSRVTEQRALEALDRVTDEVDRARADLHSFVHEVRPAVIAADGLAGALRDVARSASVPVEFVCEDDNGDLPPAFERAIWFVCSESIVNVAKHAQASRAELAVKVDAGTVHVTVADDGLGGAAEGHGSGLRGLRERIEFLGGTLSVASTVGKGTTVRAELPLGDARR